MTKFRTIWLILILLFVAGEAVVADDINSIEWIQKRYATIDSLKQLLNDPSNSDKRKTELLLRIVQQYHGVDPDNTMFYADKGISIALKMNDYDMLAQLNIEKGVNACFKGDYDLALDIFDLVEELGIKLGREKLVVDALSLKGFAYARQGKYNTAIDFYLKALPIYERIGLTERCVSVLANLSEINRLLGNTEMALQYLKQAEIKSKIWNEDDYQYGWWMPQIFNEYASNYLYLGDFDEALHFALKANSVSVENGTINLCYTKCLLANIYLKKNDYHRAMQYAKEAYIQADILKDVGLYTKVGKVLSDVYMAQNRYHEAEAEALNVWQLDSTNIDDSRTIAKNIALANIYMGNMEKAVYFLNRYSEMNVQFSEKSFHTTVSDMAVKYETEKKEQRIVSLEKERRLYVWLGVAGVVLAISLGMALWQNQRNARREKLLTATRSFLDGEMRERTRLSHDLHDRLSGSLSAVKMELGNHTESLQNIRDLLDKCINDLRHTAHDLMPASLQFGVKEALENFAARFQNVQFHFFGVEKRFEERTEYVVYCCACELVNNSINHSGAKNINLQLVQDEKHITLTVSDNGCGFDEKTATKGLGMKSIRNRVASCNGKIDVVSVLDGGTETTIELRIDN